MTHYGGTFQKDQLELIALAFAQCEKNEKMTSSQFIVPDPGQVTSLSVDDIDDYYYRAFKMNAPVFINESKVLILEYQQKEPLAFRYGHSAIVRVKSL
ncbi:MAG: hypothetical protein JJ895_12185 [Balneolaceae bacterium]|nr:hypothetical protein [Balneolaceae bacterium]